jgi:hypothetical protein
MTTKEKPIAYCPLNAVETFEFPFYIKKGVGVEPDQLLLEIHLWHMTDEEKAVMGETLEINSTEDLDDAGFATDERGVYIIGEEESWMEKPDFPTMQ